MTEDIRIALVSSLRAVRIGLRGLLAEANPGSESPPGLQAATDGRKKLSILAEAASLAEIAPQAQSLDLLLVTEEVLDPIDLERLVEGETGAPAILVLSAGLRSLRVLQKLPIRAWGLVWLDASTDELWTAIQAVHQGLLVISPGIIHESADLPNLLQGLSLPSSNRDEDGLPAARLTEREKDVLQCLAQGLANKQIALQLGISEHTVKFHVSSIYTKLGVTNRTEAVRTGIQQGLILL
jgi:DNA-binding NarL/FixJ family response regulator